MVARFAVRHFGLVVAGRLDGGLGNVVPLCQTQPRAEAGASGAIVVLSTVEAACRSLSADGQRRWHTAPKAGAARGPATVGCARGVVGGL